MSKRSDSFATYVDYTTDTNTPFYVGKGNVNRLRHVGRNKKHANVVKKHGLRREIVLSTSVEAIALEREIELIAELHTFIDDPAHNGMGCNYTPGGEGHVPCELTRKKYSNNAKERWKTNREKYCVSMRKPKRIKHTDEWKRDHSVAMSGSGNPNFGKSLKPSTVAKIRAGNLGKVPWNKDKSTKHETLQKRFKGVTVTIDGFSVTFESRKEAAAFVGVALCRSHNTVATWFVSKKTEAHGVLFTYEEK